MSTGSDLCSQVIAQGYHMAVRNARLHAELAAKRGPEALSVALWTVSLAVPEPWRFLLWGMGLAVDLGVPALIGPRFVGRVPIHASHIPERFALFTIIVLGESVVAVALGVADSDWRLPSAAGGALGFLAVGCLSWTYFDVRAGLALCPWR